MKKEKISVLLVCLVLSLLTLTGCSNNTGSAEDVLAGNVDYAAIVEDIDTTQAFTDEPISEGDITKIVNAGINAPSSMNSQNWHFTVVTNKDALSSLGGGMGSFSPPSDGTMPDMENMPEGFNFEEGSPNGERPDMSNFSGQKPEGNDMPEGAPDNMPNASFDPNTSKAGVTDAPLVIFISCKIGSEYDAGLATQNMSCEAQLLGYGTKIISSVTMGMTDENKTTFGIPEGYQVVSALLIGKVDTANYDAQTSATTRNSADELVTYVN